MRTRLHLFLLCVAISAIWWLGVLIWIGRIWPLAQTKWVSGSAPG